MAEVLFEALIVGIALTIVGMVLHKGTAHFYKHDMNDSNILAIHFFIAGALIHLLCEYSGVNKWYCSNGFACRRSS